MNRKLGENQRIILQLMRERQPVWYPGCGWVWDTRSGTIRVMESLVARGLVVKVSDRPEYRLKKETR